MKTILFLSLEYWQAWRQTYRPIQRLGKFVCRKRPQRLGFWSYAISSIWKFVCSQWRRGRTPNHLLTICFIVFFTGYSLATPQFTPQNNLEIVVFIECIILFRFHSFSKQLFQQLVTNPHTIIKIYLSNFIFF